MLNHGEMSTKRVPAPFRSRAQHRSLGGRAAHLARGLPIAGTFVNRHPLTSGCGVSGGSNDRAQGHAAVGDERHC